MLDPSKALYLGADNSLDVLGRHLQGRIPEMLNSDLHLLPNSTNLTPAKGHSCGRQSHSTVSFFLPLGW